MKDDRDSLDWAQCEDRKSNPLMGSVSYVGAMSEAWAG